MDKHSDILIIGGGFFGLYIGLYLSGHFRQVTICEKEADAMQRASYVNQARVHQGYHYPRSILTALRSKENFPKFVHDFNACIDRSFTKLYAIPHTFSKVSATQFQLFMSRIKAPIAPAPAALKKLFDAELIEDVFLVEEFAFDSAKLKKLMLNKIAEAKNISLKLNAKVTTVNPLQSGALEATIQTPDGEHSVLSHHVFNCTYSQLNFVPHNAGLPIIPLKHELTEMALVEVPDSIKSIGITVMCGPFFSIMPFPPRNLHTLSHVRYTPHHYWHDNPEHYMDAHAYFDSIPKQTNYSYMIRDAQRYVPLLKECAYVDSLWEVKTVLPLSEVDDSRPILFRKDAGLKNFHSLMGGKIDNVYDVTDEITIMLSGENDKG